jgi:antitoxin CptB
MTEESLQTLRKRLLYQSQHRGMKEMDLLLGGFAQNHLTSMMNEDLKHFESLLAIPDQILYGCFFDKDPFPDHAPKGLMLRIQAYIDSL